jgi:hypothetical protein
MAGVIGHTVVTATVGLVYKKHLNITTLFFGIGTELHVLMDLIAINGWLNGTIL